MNSTHGNAKKEILIVEDNLSDLKLLSNILSRSGYNVRSSTDSEMALQSIQSKLPDLIILDFKLPKISGVEICQRLKANLESKEIPVIFISAEDDINLKIKAFDIGAVDYITKPFNSKEVLVRINTHLSMYQMKMQQLESIGLLAGGIAHDFNNLLGGILGYTNLAQVLIDDRDAALENLAAIETMVEDATHLTHKLLTFSKGGEPIKETFDIVALIKEVVYPSISGSNIKIEFNHASNLLPVYADSGQIKQVIQNIIINAEHAMPVGGTINISCDNVYLEKNKMCNCNFSSREAGNYIKISIQDYGVGMSPEHLSKIFDPYFSTKSHGHGLGLPIIFSIIKKHAGCINVKSELGKGTTFEFYLSASEDKVIEDIKEEKTPSSGKGRILVMDDEVYIRDLLLIGLSRYGYEVKAAKNSEETIDIYKRAYESKEPFDLVILDLIIKGGAGGKLTILKLVNINPNVKAIACSGYSSDIVLSNPKEYGFVRGVSKPFLLADMVKYINNVLD